MILRHHCQLSFAPTGACGFIVVLRHHCRSLRHSCRLVANCHLPTPVGSCCFIRRSSERPKLVSILAASSPTCCGIIADFHLRSQALATSLSSVSCYFLESSVRPLQGLSCGFIADFYLHSQALATSLSSYDIIVVHCGTHADLWLTATFALLWDLAASFDEAVRDQNLSLFLRHNCRLVAASSPTFIRAHGRLRHHCRLTTPLSFVAALMPTCG
jgi:hypothetical protein